jgi:hypothetical protein
MPLNLTLRPGVGLTLSRDGREPAHLGIDDLPPAGETWPLFAPDDREPIGVITRIRGLGRAVVAIDAPGWVIDRVETARKEAS